MGEHMFRDLTLSNDLMRELGEKMQKEGARESRLHTSVLEAAYWPFSSNRKEHVMILPEMQAELDRFQTFYRVKHKGRTLNFDHSLGNAQLHARFNAGQKELQVSLYQAIILLLFNERAEISFLDIKEHTRIGR
jgi:cullin-4